MVATPDVVYFIHGFKLQRMVPVATTHFGIDSLVLAFASTYEVSMRLCQTPCANGHLIQVHIGVIHAQPVRCSETREQ